MNASRSRKYCVIGAGAAGLATCRALLQHGVEFECLEREDDVGGIFNFGKANSSIYRSTHLLSSKATSEFPDFPMPADYPPCPHHSLVLQYFQAYAREFSLYDHIRLNTGVERLEPTDNGWSVRLSSGRELHYAGVVIANGHHWDPQLPNFPGSFAGESMHAKQYKSPEPFIGKRVLVVGAGNTACDIVADAVPVALEVTMAMRRMVHFMPKYTFGAPGDVTLQAMSRWHVPMFFQRFLAWLGAWVVNGDHAALGLPQPDHRIFDANVTVSSQVPFHVRQGDVRIRPNVARLCGSEVEFVDGSRQTFDVIVYATGYRITFPFIDLEHLNAQAGSPKLFLNQFHPVRDDIAVMGLFQVASGGHWPLMHHQAQLLARVWSCRDQGRSLDWFRTLKQQPGPDLRGGFGGLHGERQKLTVEPVRFERHLRKLIEQFDRGEAHRVRLVLPGVQAARRRAA